MLVSMHLTNIKARPDVPTANELASESTNGTTYGMHDVEMSDGYTWGAVNYPGDNQRNDRVKNQPEPLDGLITTLGNDLAAPDVMAINDQDELDSSLWQTRLNAQPQVQPHKPSKRRAPPPTTPPRMLDAVHLVRLDEFFSLITANETKL